MSRPAASRIELPLGAETKILALRAGGSLPEPGDDGKRALPDRIRFLAWGNNDTAKGRVIVNETSAAVIAQNQAATRHDRVAFDFQHNSVKAGPKDEPVKVAGWGTVEVVPGEGLYLSGVEYTDEGRQVLPDGHYPDVSGAVRCNAAGEVIWVHSVGAVRNGAADGMTLFEVPAEFAEAMTVLAAGPMSADDDEDPGDELDYKVTTVELLTAAGVEIPNGIEATDSEIAGAVAAFLSSQKSSQEATKPVVTMSTAADSSPTIDPKLEERLTLLETAHLRSERQAICDRAAREGKVIPLSAEDLEKIDVTLLSAMVDKLPAGEVPLGGYAAAAQNADTNVTGAAGLTQADTKVAKLLGLDPGDVKKYGLLAETAA